MSDTVLWQCQLSGADNLTVGKIFGLHCEGKIPVTFNGPLSLSFPDKTPPFTLVLLGVKQQSPTALDLQVTSYHTGTNSLSFVRVTDGGVSMDSSALNWEVKSLLTKQSKPTPPIGPFYLGFPTSMMVAAALFLALVVAVVGALIWRQRKKSALEAALEKHRSHLKPYMQFESHLRKIRQKLAWKGRVEEGEMKPLLEDLAFSFKVYLLHRFHVIPFKMSRRALRRLILKNASVKDPRSWVSFLNELDGSLHHPQNVDVQGALQLVETANLLVTELENGK